MLRFACFVFFGKICAVSDLLFLHPIHLSSPVFPLHLGGSPRFHAVAASANHFATGAQRKRANGGCACGDIAIPSQSVPPTSFPVDMRPTFKSVLLLLLLIAVPTTLYLLMLQTGDESYGITYEHLVWRLFPERNILDGPIESD